MRISAAFFVFCLGLTLAQAPVRAQSTLPLPPAVPSPCPTTETFFGTAVTDPYRCFENMDDPAVQAFFKSQNDYTRSILAKLEPARTALFNRIRALDNAGEVVSGVQRDGPYYFYERRGPGENTTKTMVRRVGANDARVLIDPDKVDPVAGKHNTVDYFVPSFDGKYVAFGVSPGGSENSVAHVIETRTGRMLPDRITRARFGVTSWTLDGHAFYYVRLPQLPPDAPQTEAEQKAVNFLHVLGTDPDKDTPVFGYGVTSTVRFAPDDEPFVGISAGSPWALGTIAHGVQNEVTLYAAPASSVKSPTTPWKKIADVSDGVTNVDWRGNTIYLLSHKQSNRFSVLATSLSKPDLARARVVFPASQQVVEQANVAHDGLYVRTLNGAVGELYRVDFVTGKRTQIHLPYQGAISGMYVDARYDGALIGLTAWTHSLLWYAVDRNGHLTDTRLKKLSPVNASAYTSAEVAAPSADGTLVPLSLIYRKGIKLDGSHPTYLEGYGAYGVTLDPGFSTTRIAWLEHSGVYAVCHVRGGGEYGEDWHRAGMIATKEHTIQDFIGCGQYLVAHGYTSPSHLAGEGTSAGGITIGGAITQRPDLFAAALDVVGVSDALRSEFSPNGPPNIPEFGSVKTEEGFHALYTMDAYQHVKDGTAYPAVMLITGINDPRVSPWELGKFAARLQIATSSGRPILLRVDYDAGHGFLASSRIQSEQLLTDQYSFLLWQLGDPAFAATPLRNK